MDLDPERKDGYDVGDLVLKDGLGAAAKLSGLTVVRASVSPLRKPMPLEPREDSWDRIVKELERLDCRVKERSDGQATSNCPNHDDRHPSLSLSRGDDGRVLLHCHAGCEPEDVVAALGLELKDLFQRRAS